MNKAQGFLEYAMVMAAVCAVLILVGRYVRRSVQANLKIVEVQVNDEMLANVPVGGGESSVPGSSEPTPGGEGGGWAPIPM